MNKIICSIFIMLVAINLHAQPTTKHDLQFDSLATVWDEAIPLGNGTVGALIWKNGDKLRFSLDRADIWDMRPMAGLHRKEFSYKWVQEQVEKKEYKPVQQYFDAPYDKEPAPSKIPAGALEFGFTGKSKVKSVHLSLEKALCEVKWEGGMTLKTFVHATEPVGWFKFENVRTDIITQLIAPKYHGKLSGGEVNSLVGDDLARLGYKQGKVNQRGNTIVYKQEGWGGFTYEITVQWRKVTPGTIEGVWSISSQYPEKKLNPVSSSFVKTTMLHGFEKGFLSHVNWWKKFWGQSAIHVPDPVIEKQWYLEQYKFGSAARRGAPPISLQAVWTADNGRIPPWKGDFHHDLNTQLSYWPSYSGNHLEEGLGYFDHLDENLANYKRYTKMYFGVDGLAVPGVTTLDGTEMGGWIQYSLSPTVSSWLAHHYYLQWRYSMDTDFLKNRAYPWVKEVCTFLENITVKDSTGQRKLPISSSPEIKDNSLEAWFPQNTNYDLALMKFSFSTGAELALELGLVAESDHWKSILSEFGDYAFTENNELMFAPGLPYEESHRHFSHMMAIHPLGLIKWEDGEKSQKIIKNTIALLDKVGPDYWCGYSYAWLANMKARAKDGEGAAKDLSIFAKAFVLPNSFHVNGDQSKSGLSKFTYRPFTLEGNFAFAAGLQEMMLQSYAGFIEIMPAVPASWKDIAFEKLRAEGAFLISAKKENGQVTEVKIDAEKDGVATLRLPFKKYQVLSAKKVVTNVVEDGFVELKCKAGGSVILKAEL
ncbi:glycosyl hydrolase family 95 catalytic domain-containing protein [Dyadobacter sp. 3J3]|uniref:glycosyl hydrolase family 95 catalytic domain-containing protein n=1 Tax=Dyadobacter sp. 3J3 TaxID=2606600 RepID=UPI001356E837|nr:glycoside hydrolase N-terminal domain-containing protein [Dyadobacter sp. 3J3]